MLVLRAGLKSSYGSLFLIGVFMSVWRLLFGVEVGLASLGVYVVMD